MGACQKGELELLATPLPRRDGLDITRATALVVATGMLVGAGMIALRRRDVGC